MRLYIIGPSAGLPECNRQAFMDAEALLRRLGYDTANPARLRDDQGLEHGHPQESLLQLMDCDGAALLEGWQNDAAARQEKNTANYLRLPVQALDTWPRMGPALPPVKVKRKARQMVGMANKGRGLHTVAIQMPDYGQACIAPDEEDQEAPEAEGVDALAA